MVVLIAYLMVVLIWATTPLTIQWSSDSLSFIAAVLLRMSFALSLGLIINTLLGRKLFAHPQVWRVYAAGAIGIFPNMPVVYWSAQYIPSGMVAVVFAMSPFVTGLMTLVLLKQNPFTVKRIFALAMALVGLQVIFYHQFQFDMRAVYGIVGILLSCFLFSFSSVLVKKMDTGIGVDAFNQALGTVLFALPGLLISWWYLDGHIPSNISTKSLASVGYLSVFGSLIGAALFFYVLARMSASAVSLITFMTPILALIWGAWAGKETLSWQLWLGAALVILALLLYLEVSSEGWAIAGLRRHAWQGNELEELKSEHHKYR